MDLSEGGPKGKNKKKRGKRNGDKETLSVEVMDRGKENSRLREDLSKTDSKKNLPEIDLSVQPQAEKLEISVDSDEKNSQSNTAKEKKKKARKKNKAIIPDEIHIMDVGKDDSGWKENLFEIDPEKNLLETDLSLKSQAEEMKIFLDSKEQISEGNAEKKKKKMSKSKKKKAVIRDEVHIMDWGKEDPGWTENAFEKGLKQNLLETDSSVQLQTEMLKTAANSKEKNSEGNAEKKKKKRVSIPDEVHINDWGKEGSGWTENLPETDLKQNRRDINLPLQLQAEKLEIIAESKEQFSKENIVEKKKMKNKKKAATQDEDHIMDWVKQKSLLSENAFGTNSKQNLLDKDLSVQLYAEKLEIVADPKEQITEGNGEKKKKKMKKKKASFPDEVHILDGRKEDSEWTENLSEADLEQNLCDTNISVQLHSEKLDIVADSNEQISERNIAMKNKKKKKKAAPQYQVHIMDWGKQNSVMTENAYETDLKQNLLETDLSVQLQAGQLEFVADSREQISEGNGEKKKKKKKEKKIKAIIPDEVHVVDGGKEDSVWTENLPETDLSVQLQAGQLEFVADSREQISEGNGEKKKKKKKEKKIKAIIPDEVHVVDGGKEDSVWTENLPETDLEQNLLDTDLSVQLQSQNLEINVDSKGQISEENIAGKKKKKKKKESIPDEVHIMDGGKEDLGWAENLFEKDLKQHPLETDLSVKSKTEKLEIIPDSEEKFSEVNADKKNKKKLRKKKAKFQEEVQVAEITAVSTQNLLETELKENLTEIALTMHPQAQYPEMTADLIENITEENADRKKRKRFGSNKKNVIPVKFHATMDGTTMESLDTENHAPKSLTGNRKRKRSMKNVKTKDEVPVVNENAPRLDLIAEPSRSLEYGLCAVNNEVILDSEKSSGDGRAEISNCYVKATEYLSVGSMNNEMCSSPGIPLTVSIRRKLLVLDVNGLLADIVMPAPKNCRGDIHIYGRAVFQRPFCHDFLRFCFQNFDVGIWSSRSKKVIDRIVDYLLGNLKDKLLFCWDMQHTTSTGFKTLENKHKPLVCKELRKIWENDNPNFPWKKGDYDESNTLLLDDSPYKALLNPLHTAIFPSSFSYVDKNDNSLGPGGDLRVYLEDLLKSENVQKYVEQYPFGQRAIDDKGRSWEFYAEVLRKISKPLENKTCHPAAKLNNSLPMEACC